MADNDRKITLHQGDTKTWTFTWAVSGSPSIVDLSGATLTGDIRLEYDSDVVGSFYFVETDMANGQFTFGIDEATSSALPVKSNKTSFVFDIQVTFPGSPVTIETPYWGYLIVQREVTK